MPKCACVHPNDLECFKLRHNGNDLDEHCECYCHQGDEDGMSEWDYEDEAEFYAENVYWDGGAWVI